MAADDVLLLTPRVACVGPFHVDAFGPALARRILAAELARRLPDAEVTWWAPAPRSPAARLDPGLPPLVGDPRDVAPAGADAPDVVVEVGDDLTLAALGALAPRHVPTEVRAQRRAHLAAIEVLVPVDGRLALPADPSGGAAVPVDATVDDLVAAIEGASAVESDDPVVAAVAAAFGTGLATAPEPAVVAARLDDVARDAIAALAHRTGTTVEAVEHARAARFAADVAAAHLAHDRAGQRAALARQRLVEALQDALHDNDRLRAAADRLGAAEARAELLDAELRALRATKTFRATATVRAWYGRIRGGPRRDTSGPT